MPCIKSLFRAFVARRTFRRTEIMKSETQGTYSAPCRIAPLPLVLAERRCPRARRLAKVRMMYRAATIMAPSLLSPSLSLFPSFPPRFPLDRPLSFLTPINTSPPKLSRNVIDIDVVLTKEDLQDIIEKSFGSASSEEFLAYEN